MFLQQFMANLAQIALVDIKINWFLQKSPSKYQRKKFQIFCYTQFVHCAVHIVYIKRFLPNCQDTSHDHSWIMIMHIEFINTCCSKRLHKKRVSWYWKSSFWTIVTLSPFIEMTKQYQFKNFSCLFTFYSSSKFESDSSPGLKKTKSPRKNTTFPVICK